MLFLADWISVGLDGTGVTVAAAMAIVVAGLPHGTLDVEIAAKQFGKNDATGKAVIIIGYGGCALAMVVLWMHAPELALVSFLAISIIHFSNDWRGGVDSFLAMMVGWALVALPALTRPQEVALIFQILTGNTNGPVIAALLACTSVPATLGSLVFCFWAFKHEDNQNAIDVLTCIIAACLLPPLVAFAVFFCGLHSPRHMIEALRETGGMSVAKKLTIIAAVFALSLGLGAMIHLSDRVLQIDENLIRTAFILISVLTVPHFMLEKLITQFRRRAATRN